MTRWLVQVDGDRFDLEEFPFWFPSGEIYAIQESSTVFLVGPRFEQLTEASQVHEVAAAALDGFYAVIFLLDAGIRKPLLGTVFREKEDGTRDGFAFGSGSCSIRSKARGRISDAGSGGANDVIRPTQAQSLLAAVPHSRHLQVALSLIAIPNATWPHFYRCLEEVELALGANVDKLGLCNGGERERFRRTANSPQVSGLSARHGFGKHEPPKNPMSRNEGLTFVRQILQAALTRGGGSQSTWGN